MHGIRAAVLAGLGLAGVVFAAACGNKPDFTTPRLAPALQSTPTTERAVSPAVVAAVLRSTTPEPASVVVSRDPPAVAEEPAPQPVAQPTRRVASAQSGIEATVSDPTATPTPRPTARVAIQDATATPTMVARPQAAATPVPTATAGPATQGKEHPSVARARALAARHLGLEESLAHALTLESREAVTWSSSALGCTRTGFAYATAEVDGYRITFSHEGR